MRLLMTRGWVSKTFPLPRYVDVAGTGTLGPKKPAGAPSAARKTGVVSRGNAWSAAEKFSSPGLRLLHDPSTVRRPYDVMMSGTCSASGVVSVGEFSRVLHGCSASSVVACRSAILICLRMKLRSPAVTLKPAPTGPAAADAGSALTPSRHMVADTRIAMLATPRRR